MSTVEHTRYARVFHCRQWSNYNIESFRVRLNNRYAIGWRLWASRSYTLHTCAFVTKRYSSLMAIRWWCYSLERYIQCSYGCRQSDGVAQDNGWEIFFLSPLLFAIFGDYRRRPSGLIIEGHWWLMSMHVWINRELGPTGLRFAVADGIALAKSASNLRQVFNSCGDGAFSVTLGFIGYNRTRNTLDYFTLL